MSAKLGLFIRCSVVDNFVPISLVATVVGIIALASRVYGFEVRYSIYSYPVTVVGPSFLLIGLLFVFVGALIKERPLNPVDFLVCKLITDWKCAERAARGTPLLVVLPVFFSSFTSYKAAMGRNVEPFHFDPYAAYIDRLLHGTDAWSFFSPITAYPGLTYTLYVIYNIWFHHLFAVLTFCLFFLGDTRSRNRYFIAFFSCWFVLGVVGATALSSAGPCFYQHFYGARPYEHIAEYLSKVSAIYPIDTLSSQSVLLAFYDRSTPGLGLGISAAPSMHVSIATLTALFVSRYGFVASVAGWLFCLAILLATIHLGWHYAIDGYLAILVTVIIWKLSGAIADIGVPDILGKTVEGFEANRPVKHHTRGCEFRFARV